MTLENIYFELMNNKVFGKILKIVRKHRDIKTVIIESRRNYLVSDPNYHTTKLLAAELKKKKEKRKNRCS